MAKIVLDKIQRFETPRNAVFHFQSAEHTIGLLTEDPFDEFDYTVTFSATHADIQAILEDHWDASYTEYTPVASTVVSNFGNEGEKAEAGIAPTTEDPLGFWTPVWQKKVANYWYPSELEDGLHGYYGSKTNTVLNRDRAAVPEIVVKYSQTVTAAVLETLPNDEVLNTEYKGATGYVQNNSTQGSTDVPSLTTPMFALQNLSVTINPHQFVDIMLQFGSQVEEVLQLPQGLVLDARKHITGIAVYAGIYDITIKLANNDAIDGKLIILPVTRLA